jgi:diaminopimelate epimerase
LVKLINQPFVTIKVLGRNYDCLIREDGTISVNMGSAVFAKEWMPEQNEIIKVISRICKISHQEFLCVDIGNPHLIIFKSGLTIEDQEQLGKLFKMS